MEKELSQYAIPLTPGEVCGVCRANEVAILMLDELYQLSAPPCRTCPVTKARCDPNLANIPYVHQLG